MLAVCSWGMSRYNIWAHRSTGSSRSGDAVVQRVDWTASGVFVLQHKLGNKSEPALWPSQTRAYLFRSWTLLCSAGLTASDASVRTLNPSFPSEPNFVCRAPVMLLQSKMNERETCRFILFTLHTQTHICSHVTALNTHTLLIPVLSPLALLSKWIFRTELSLSFI